MRTTLPALVVLVALLPCACGSSGPPLEIVNPDMGRTLVGDEFEYEILFEGGCGGDYVLELVKVEEEEGEDGEEGEGGNVLPPGLFLVDVTHSIEGIPEEVGEFEFELEISDRGCIRQRNFWERARAVFRLTVLPQPIDVVEVVIDGTTVPLIPVGEGEHTWSVTQPDTSVVECTAVYNPYFPALPAVARDASVRLELVCTGGLGGPYRMESFVDPDGASDPLPDGVTIEEDSTVLAGTPTTVGPAITIDCADVPTEVEGPYVLTFRLIDQSGASRFWTCNWLVYEPSP